MGEGADSIAAAPFAVGSRLRIFHGGKVYPIALWEPALLQEIERLLDMRLGEGGTTCTDKQDRVHGQTGGDDVLEGVLHVWQWGRLIEPVEQFLAAALQAEVDAAQAPGAHLLELLNAVAQAGESVDEGMKPQEPRCAAAGPVGAHHLVRLGEFKTEAKDFEEWGEELEWNPEGVGLAQEDGGFSFEVIAVEGNGVFEMLGECVRFFDQERGVTIEVTEGAAIEGTAFGELEDEGEVLIRREDRDGAVDLEKPAALRFKSGGRHAVRFGEDLE